MRGADGGIVILHGPVTLQCPRLMLYVKTGCILRSDLTSQWRVITGASASFPVRHPVRFDDIKARCFSIFWPRSPHPDRDVQQMRLLQSLASASLTWNVASSMRKTRGSLHYNSRSLPSWWEALENGERIYSQTQLKLRYVMCVVGCVCIDVHRRKSKLPYSDEQRFQIHRYARPNGVTPRWSIHGTQFRHLIMEIWRLAVYTNELAVLPANELHSNHSWTNEESHLHVHHLQSPQWICLHNVIYVRWPMEIALAGCPVVLRYLETPSQLKRAITGNLPQVNFELPSYFLPPWEQ